MGSGGRIGELWTPEERHCFYLLQRIPSQPVATSSAAASSLLKIQAFLLRRGTLHANLSLFTRLISAFSDLAAPASPLVAAALLRHARRLFDCRPSQDAFLCGSFIRALVRNRLFRESIFLYRDLLRHPPSPVEPPFSPDGYTFPLLLKACAALSGDPSEHREGPQLHSHVIKTGFCGHAFSSTGLVDMYAKTSDMTSARKVFDDMPLKSLASWTSMAIGYARGGEAGAAMELFQLMPEKDTAAFNAMIDVFVKKGHMASARRLFDEMSDRNVVSWTSLISGYCKVGDMEAASVLFDAMPEKNLYSWNVMIGGHCQNRQPHQALELFRELQSTCCLPQPDNVTLVSVLPAVADLGAIDLGRWIHSYARRKGLDQVITVSIGLVDMYAKCGDVCEARRVFDSMPIRDTAAWNAMINGLAVNGRAKAALAVFTEMRRAGVCPNEVTMIGVLSACSHGGLVEEGRRWFNEMEALHVERRVEHYGCMVDLLGRSGRLGEAETLLEEIPCGPNGIVLSSLLFACGRHGDMERAERAMRRASAVEPGNWRNYVVMRNLYARKKKWRDVERMQEAVRDHGGKREAGCSVVEVGHRAWEFVSGDRVHPQSQSIYELLDELLQQIKGQGEEEEDRLILASEVQSTSVAVS
ncbi:pentatricopeptide repeat-containing protein At2g44880-like [Musa acuminata AAA Group]|uniref:pentatricopeptide repeat-containing protein At2g44880-like n=1 Tax=Musa acuminata AAA Group TaxID=214697 RepID=UPI0031D3B914